LGQNGDENNSGENGVEYGDINPGWGERLQVPVLGQNPVSYDEPDLPPASAPVPPTLPPLEIVPVLSNEEIRRVVEDYNIRPGPMEGLPMGDQDRDPREDGVITLDSF
jgi:hypothetical protein